MSGLGAGRWRIVRQLLGMPGAGTEALIDMRVVIRGICAQRRTIGMGWHGSIAAHALILSLILAVATSSPFAQTAGPAFPLTFQQAVQYAADHYPAIQASMARVSAQESAVDLARTAYLPRLDSTLQINRATHSNVTGALFPGTPLPSISGPPSDAILSSSIWGSAAGLLLSWEPIDFGQRGAAVDLARASVARAHASAELTRLDVGVRTADAFLQLAAAQETVRAARANVERQDTFSNAVAVLVKHQLRPGADDSRAQAELASARVQLAQAEQAEQIGRAALAQWLGVSPTDVRIEGGLLLAAAPPPPATAPAAASHPLAETQMASVASSRAIQHLLNRSYFPRINLQSAYWRRGTGVTADGTERGGAEGLDFKTPNWAIGFTATFPIFDWYSLRERKRIEAHNERAEVATYDRVVRELSAQAEQARAQMEGARRVAENTPTQLAAARVLEQQARVRYDAGLATIIEVADAQRLLLQAEVGEAIARLGVWRARLAEAAAQGDLSELLK